MADSSGGHQPSPASRARHIAFELGRFAVSIGILWFLVYRLRQSDPATFDRLGQESIDLRWLAVGWLMSLIEALLGCLRWWLAMRAFGLAYPLATVVRLGLLAITINFLGIGPVGGDLARALLLVRGQKGLRVRAVASVVVDRVLGLAAMLAIVAMATTFYGVDQLPGQLRLTLGPLRWFVAAGSLVLAWVFVSPAASRLMTNPRVPTVLRGVSSSVVPMLELCRAHLPIVVGVGVLSVALQSLQVVAAVVLANALPGAAPTLREMAVILPLAFLSGLIPLPLGGLGLLDFAVSSLYPPVTAGRVQGAQGLLMITLMRSGGALIAACGLGLYAFRRREIASIAREIRNEGDAHG